MKQLVLVFLGSGLGSVLRFGIGKYFNISTSGFPMGTFIVNILGSFLVGVILGLALRGNTLSNNQVLFLATGFCGGFTTFSAFAYENQIFLKSGDFTSFALYTITSFVLGFSAVFFGMWAVKFL